MIKSRSGYDYRLRWMLAAHFFWLTVVSLLGAWWGRLLLQQAWKIAELEEKLGWARNITETYWHRTQRMLFWESITFFTLLLASTSILFWIYWRDVKRARGLEAFFASVTHEMRTPLTSIRLQAESIAENLSHDLPEKNLAQKNLVCRLLEDTIRLEGQVERTLELARVEGGGPVCNQTLQIKPWLDRFLKSWTADYQDKVVIQTEIEDVVLEADPTALQIIFKNLFENSVRHARQEKVLIHVFAKRLSESGGEKVELYLRDNGTGYHGNQQDLGRLFQKGPSSVGTGVGLYLVKALMKKMGGKAGFFCKQGFEVSLIFSEGKLSG